MEKKKSSSLLADHPIVVVLGLIASILGILGFSLRDLWLPSNLFTPATSNQTATDQTFRHTLWGWVTEVTIYPSSEKVVLRTLIPSGMVYDLMTELNPVMNYNYLSMSYITFEAYYFAELDSEYPTPFRISEVSHDPKNQVLEAAGYPNSSLDLSNSPSLFFIKEGDTLFIKNPKEGVTRLHFKTLPAKFDSTEDNKVVIIISFTKRGHRFDDLLSP